MVGRDRFHVCRPTTSGESGYAMAALLVAIALMSVFMSAALPAWRHAAQREKEAELLWRGRQYDRALQLYRRKHSIPGPASVDVLLEEKFLRKKYKDPITGGDFDLRPVSPTGEALGGGETETGPSSRASSRASRRRRTSRAPPGRGAGQLIGGVRSTSKEKSILVLNGRQRYNEWDFTYVPYQDARNQGEAEGNRGRPGVSPRTPRGSSRGRSPSTRGTTPRQGSRESAPPSRTPQ